MTKLWVGLLVAAATLTCGMPASAAIIVSLSPGSDHVAVGDVVSVDLTISGLDVEILSAYDLDLLFDAAVLSALDTVPDLTQLGGAGSTIVDIGIGVGRREVIALSMLSDVELAALPQADAFTLVTFTFQALAEGIATLRLGPDPDFERNFVGFDALSLEVQVGEACIAVGAASCRPVSEPALLALLGAGLTTVAARRRAAAARDARK